MCFWINWHRQLVTSRSTGTTALYGIRIFFSNSERYMLCSIISVAWVELLRLCWVQFAIFHVLDVYMIIQYFRRKCACVFMDRYGDDIMRSFQRDLLTRYCTNTKTEQARLFDYRNTLIMHVRTHSPTPYHTTVQNNDKERRRLAV